MPFVGTIPGQPVDPRDRGVDRARERRKAMTPIESFRRALDEAELSSVDQVDAAEGLRSVKANEEEESREDRTEHGYYRPGGAAQGKGKPKLDLEG